MSLCCLRHWRRTRLAKNIIWYWPGTTSSVVEEEWWSRHEWSPGLPTLLTRIEYITEEASYYIIIIILKLLRWFSGALLLHFPDDGRSASGIRGCYLFLQVGRSTTTRWWERVVTCCVANITRSLISALGLVSERVRCGMGQQQNIIPSGYHHPAYSAYSSYSASCFYIFCCCRDDRAMIIKCRAWVWAACRESRANVII